MQIKEEEEWKTAFNIPLGQCEYWVVPFGLQGVAMAFYELNQLDFAQISIQRRSNILG